MVDLLDRRPASAAHARKALFHNGINLSFDDALHHLDFRKLVGRGVAVYGQQEIVKDLIARASGRMAAESCSKPTRCEIEGYRRPERPKIQVQA